MVIVFDMDNTLIDEMGSGVRPGIPDFLDALMKDGHTLILWTSSSKSRACYLLRTLELARHFSQFVFREDYDPDRKGLPKDIRKVNGDMLVDDDPREISFVKGIKKAGFLISPYRQNSNPPPEEIISLRRMIKRKSLLARLYR